MLILVIDTALGACTAAVFDDDRCLAVESETMLKGHQERLGGFVRDAMAEAGIAFAALDRIGVTVGPGSFTGLRVGLAFAQGLGAALDRPVVGVSTLAGLAETAMETAGFGRVFAAIDARRGQVYAQAFEHGHPTSPPEALTLDQAAERLGDLDPDCIVGTGAALLTAFAPRASLQDHVAPSSQALGRLVLRADPTEALPRPLYLRAPDATVPTRLPGQPRPVAS